MGKFWWTSEGYGSNGSLSQGWMQNKAYGFFMQYTAMCWTCRMSWSPPKPFGSTKADSFWTARSSLLLLWHGTACETNLFFFPSLGCEEGQQAINTLLCKTWCQSIIMISYLPLQIFLQGAHWMLLPSANQAKSLSPLQMELLGDEPAD